MTAPSTEKQDLDGKVFIVTGANSGIGFIAARNFASRGASVALVCRDGPRGAQAIAAIKQQLPQARLSLYLADFSRLASVSDLAQRLLADFPVIDVLCNNAGGANGARIETSEGFELTFVTNHLGSHLLTQELLPGLLAAGNKGSARVVFTSSLGHKNSPLDFDDLNLSRGYSTLKAYGRSKLMNLLTARELQRRYGDKNLICSSFHPGAVRTPIWGKGGALARVLGIVMYPFMVNMERGADTMIWLASAEDSGSVQANGNYFYERRQVSIAPFATAAAATMLWTVSDDLVSSWRLKTTS